MEKPESAAHKYGLVGRNISYSFSRGYFSKKFAALGLHSHTYENFDLASIEEFPALLEREPSLRGLNVTIPYKEAILPYLDDQDPEAKGIGAVNVIRIRDGRLRGFNTDAHGFREALSPFLKRHHTKSLVLGTGGASRAVVYVLKNLGLNPSLVSRETGKAAYSYADLSTEIMEEFTVIVNATPLGTFPNVEARPSLPYEALGPRHLLFDLIYNPDITAFMKAGESMGATVVNGRSMLEKQAEKAWEIWKAK